MPFYYTILFIAGVFSLLEIENLKKKNVLALYALLCFFLYVLSFIRWETGTDWGSYYSYFTNSSNLGSDSNYEPLFAFINIFANDLTGDYTFCLFILSSILFYFQTKGVYKMSIYPLTSLFMLVGIQFANVNYVRQWVAAMILFYSVYYIRQRKLFPYLALVITACLFHRTSFIFLLAWWVYHLHLSKKTMVILMCVCVAFSSFISTLFDSIGGFFGEVIQYKLSVYMDDYDGVEDTGFSPFITILKGVLNKCVIFFIILFFIDKITEKYPYVRGYFNLYWFGIILYFSLVGVNIIFVRFSYAYDILLVILFPYIFSVIKKNSNKIFVWGVLLVYLMMRMYVYLNSYFDLFVPFKTILEIS